jgi:hypothetical protein
MPEKPRGEALQSPGILPVQDPTSRSRLVFISLACYDEVVALIAISRGLTSWMQLCFRKPAVICLAMPSMKPVYHCWKS